MHLYNDMEQVMSDIISLNMNKRTPIVMVIIPCLMMCLGSVARAEVPFEGIVCPTSFSRQELTAAKEIRRYVYLRTGSLLVVSQSDNIPRDHSSYIVIGRKGRAIIKDALSDCRRDSCSGEA
jgi:hypothetical protein